MYADWRCNYHKTVNGFCDQQRERGEQYCYYHTRVIAGFIETDESRVMRGMQTLSK